MTREEIMELIERSKNDRAIIVGSEVRSLGMAALQSLDARDSAIEECAKVCDRNADEHQSASGAWLSQGCNEIARDACQWARQAGEDAAAIRALKTAPASPDRGIQDFIREQQPLPADMAKVLHDNYWELLESSPESEQKADDGVWLIFFEDNEMRPEVFSETGAEAAAKERYRQVVLNWSCHLFQKVDMTASPDREQRGEVNVTISREDLEGGRDALYWKRRAVNAERKSIPNEIDYARLEEPITPREQGNPLERIKWATLNFSIPMHDHGSRAVAAVNSAIKEIEETPSAALPASQPDDWRSGRNDMNLYNAEIIRGQFTLGMRDRLELRWLLRKVPRERGIDDGINYPLLPDFVTVRVLQYREWRDIKQPGDRWTGTITVREPVWEDVPGVKENE